MGCVSHMLHGDPPQRPPEHLPLREITTLPLEKGGWVLGCCFSHVAHDIVGPATVRGIPGAYDARFRVLRVASGNRARRRAGGIATTGTVVVRMTPSVVDPKSNRDARPTPRYPITIRSQP